MKLSISAYSHLRLSPLEKTLLNQLTLLPLRKIVLIRRKARAVVRHPSIYCKLCAIIIQIWFLRLLMGT